MATAFELLQYNIIQKTIGGGGSNTFTSSTNNIPNSIVVRDSNGSFAAEDVTLDRIIIRSSTNPSRYYYLKYNDVGSKLELYNDANTLISYFDINGLSDTTYE